jgi:hypothetical protein
MQVQHIQKWYFKCSRSALTGDSRRIPAFPLFLLCGIIVSLSFSVPLIAQPVMINEFMASNSGFLFDEDGDDSDWIELYNRSSESVQLAGFSLSDDARDVGKWMLPDMLLPPGEFLLIFASGKDRSVSGNELHTNFRINAAGEDVLLGYEGVVIQHIDPVMLKSNTSYGALPDGAPNYVVFVTPTPGASNAGEHFNDSVEFSHSGGRYENGFSLVLSSSIPGYQIRYTLDGEIPTFESPSFSDAIVLTEDLLPDPVLSYVQMAPLDLHVIPEEPIIRCIVVKAAVFDDEGRQRSEVASHSYFIDAFGSPKHAVPVISLTTDREGLINDTTGIMVPGVHWKENDPYWTGNYFQRWSDWERGATLEYFDVDGEGFTHAVGIRIRGGFTRRRAQKGLTIYARNQYGRNSIDYPLFGEDYVTSFRRLALRSFSSSTYSTGIEDYLAHCYALAANTEHLATKPVVLYINGEYWGIYFLQERFDNHYLTSHRLAADDDVDIIVSWYGIPEAGDNEDFVRLYEFMAAADMSDPSHYAAAAAWMDIDNFIDYQLLEIFIANTDWPASNVKMWRERKIGAKWRWLFFDGDASLIMSDFDGFENALSTSDQHWPTNATSTLFLRKLLENESFKERFLDRLEELLNDAFTYEHAIRHFLDVTMQINGDIPHQLRRFENLPDYIDWVNALAPMYHFLRYRHCEIGEQVRERFGRVLNIPACPSTSITDSIRADEAVISGIELYPNPARSHVFVTISSTSFENGTVMMTDVLGRTVLRRDLFIRAGSNELHLPIADIAAGQYLLQVRTQSHVKSRIVRIIR